MLKYEILEFIWITVENFIILEIPAKNVLFIVFKWPYFIITASKCKIYCSGFSKKHSYTQHTYTTHACACKYYKSLFIGQCRFHQFLILILNAAVEKWTIILDLLVKLRWLRWLTLKLGTSWSTCNNKSNVTLMPVTSSVC